MATPFFERPTNNPYLESIMQTGQNMTKRGMFANPMQSNQDTQGKVSTSAPPVPSTTPPTTGGQGGSSSAGGGQSGAQASTPTAPGQVSARSVDREDSDVSVDLGPLGTHSVGVADVAAMADPTGVVGAFNSAVEALGLTKGIVGKDTISPAIGTTAFDVVTNMSDVNMGIDQAQADLEGAAEDAAEANEAASADVAAASADVDAGVEGAEAAAAGAQADAQAAQNDMADLEGDIASVDSAMASVSDTETTSQAVGNLSPVGRSATGIESDAAEAEAAESSSEAEGTESDGGEAEGADSGEGGGTGGVGEASAGGSEGVGQSTGGVGEASAGGSEGVGPGADSDGGEADGGESDGGYIKGGLLTDKNPETNQYEQKFANVSEGEFVMSRAAVEYFGLKRLQDMNRKAREELGTVDPSGQHAEKQGKEKPKSSGMFEKMQNTVDKSKKQSIPKRQQ